MPELHFSMDMTSWAQTWNCLTRNIWSWRISTLCIATYPSTLKCQKKPTPKTYASHCSERTGYTSDSSYSKGKKLSFQSFRKEEALRALPLPSSIEGQLVEASLWDLALKWQSARWFSSIEDHEGWCGAKVEHSSLPYLAICLLGDKEQPPTGLSSIGSAVGQGSHPACTPAKLSGLLWQAVPCPEKERILLFNQS